MHGLDLSLPIFGASAPKPAQGLQTAAPQVAEKPDDDSSFFDDLLDVVNPLQHLPVIGSIYRAITGDKISIPARIAGDGLYGGLVGLATSVADTIFEGITGKTVGATVMAFLFGEDGPQTIPNNIASNTPAQTPAALPSATLSGGDIFSETMQSMGAQADAALRARYAYARSMILEPQELATS